MRPAPLTKSIWKAKNPPTSGTNNTPPPTPPRTANIPRIKVKTNSIIDHAHQGIFEPFSAASCTVDGSVVASTVPATKIIVSRTKEMKKNLDNRFPIFNLLSSFLYVCFDLQHAGWDSQHV